MKVHMTLENADRLYITGLAFQTTRFHSGLYVILVAIWYKKSTLYLAMKDLAIIPKSVKIGSLFLHSLIIR